MPTALKAIFHNLSVNEKIEMEILDLQVEI
jgi:hypothetical protein